jgi:hypothetical protein
MAVAPSWVAETVVKLPLNCYMFNSEVSWDVDFLTAAVGVRLALMMYASRISFPCGAELLNCLCMLASRCWGREIVLIEVRRAADDMFGVLFADLENAGMRECGNAGMRRERL